MALIGLARYSLRSLTAVSLYIPLILSLATLLLLHLIIIAPLLSSPPGHRAPPTHLRSPSLVLSNRPTLLQPQQQQVTRALTIKTQYLTKTAGQLEAKRKEAEVAVESGIMGLGLLSKDSA